MSTTVRFTAPNPPESFSRFTGVCDDCKTQNTHIRRISVDGGGVAWVCRRCLERRPGVEELPGSYEVTKISEGLITWKKASQRLLMLGGETPEEAKVTIDLTTGDVMLTTPVKEGALLFWEAAEALLKVQLGTGARCSCECGCNRKLTVYDAFQRMCSVCDAGIHVKKNGEEKETKESGSE